MNNIKILVIGRHSFMLDKVCSLLIQNGYDAKGCLTDSEAYSLMSEQKFNAVVIGGGVEEESRNAFHRDFIKTNTELKIIDAHPQTILQDLSRVFPF